MTKLVLNWKMNKPDVKISEYIEKLNEIKKDNDIEIILAPSFIQIPEISKNKDKINLSAQDISKNEKGAFTGEISPLFLNEFDVDYVIIGHSERREFHGEYIEDIIDKAKNAINNKLKPIICLGETKEIYEKGKSQEHIIKEINLIKKHLKESLGKIILAYEPVWAVGKNINFSQDEYLHIKNNINILKSHTKSEVVYGGSVNLKNINNLIKHIPVDGFLLGGPSLDITAVNSIIEQMKG